MDAINAYDSQASPDSANLGEGREESPASIGFVHRPCKYESSIQENPQLRKLKAFVQTTFFLLEKHPDLP